MTTYLVINICLQDGVALAEHHHRTHLKSRNESRKESGSSDSQGICDSIDSADSSDRSDSSLALAQYYHSLTYLVVPKCVPGHKPPGLQDKQQPQTPGPLNRDVLQEGGV